MHFFHFVGGVLLLLLTPGPTNTLMMLAGYSSGWRTSVGLIAAELGGYLAIIISIGLVAATVFVAYPQASLWMKGLAAAWVLFLSWRLWRSSHSAKEPEEAIGPRTVFMTTLLNPKAPIIALVLLPQGSAHEVLPWLLGFALLVVLAANLWLAVGSLVANGSGKLLTPPAMRKCSAAGLLGFAVLLAGSSVHATG